MGNEQSTNATSVASRSKAGTKAVPGGQFVDGFRRPSRASAAAHKAAQSTVRPSSLTPHQPEPARTLMRTAVRKPDIVAPSRLKAQTRTDLLAKAPSQAVAPKISQASVNAKRLKKAARTVKHPQVSRYGSPSAISAIQRTEPMSAASLHANSQPAHHASDIDRIQSSLSRATAHQTSAVSVVPVASAPQHQAKPDIFAEAMAQATSHEQTYEPEVTVSKKQRRNAILVTSVLCLLLAAGTMAYLNAPMLSLKVASVRAGVSAKLPGFVPQGFNYGTLSYGRGNVTVSYANAADPNRRYDITQRTSDWDSQTLLTNFVETANKAYQTYSQAGRTVYMYGDNTATWVDSGVWYTVNGNSALSREQILNLAGSL